VPDPVSGEADVSINRRPVNRDLPSSALLPFVVFAFAITWGVIGFYIFFPKQAVALFGQISGSHPLFFLATWAPAISALVLIFFHGGVAGLRRFLSRLQIWRCSVGWAAFVLVGLPLVFLAGSLLKGGALLAPLPPEGMFSLLVLMFMMLLLGPVEELGWRGVALPILQRHFAPFWAGAIVGAIWGVWHLPAFHLAGVVFEDWSFLPFFIGNVTLAILVTPLFNSTRGSLLLPMLFHWQLINPFWPDAQPWDTWILVAVTLLVVWVKRASMFTRTGAVTQVIPLIDEIRL
jgi:membrane protease YdiL (CAAX protease family)